VIVLLMSRRRCRELMSFQFPTDCSDITLQHLSSSIGPSLTSSAHPSQTSATKFLNQRLYSKKRQVAVLASSAPQPNQERNPKKQKKGGLSLETRMLLGLDEPEDAEKEKQREKKKKRNLLLQAEGQRKTGEFPLLPLQRVIGMLTSISARR